LLLLLSLADAAYLLYLLLRHAMFAAFLIIF